jgi:hypothetical protein
MPLIAFFSNIRINGIRIFDSPPDAEGFPLCDFSLRPDRVVKPPATPSFMDYFFMVSIAIFHKINHCG